MIFQIIIKLIIMLEALFVNLVAIALLLFGINILPIFGIVSSVNLIAGLVIGLDF